ncbi:doublecortin domain-containing protein 2-like isoform X3 [Mya arenaria]|uniref:doublecortin domain-containing protein 2-like isoform X3 n=1 Tax=Mya arenaria TaxID=6604 RepID=UPI0022E26917|nr:doublecortin domain-containing protein 2-like isoform X3 [Mya arenaria]
MATKNPRPPKQPNPLPNGYVSKDGGAGSGAEPYDAHDEFQAHYLPKEPRAMHIRVHVNKDTFEPGKKITIQKNKVKTFENFLNECTEKCKPPFGCARRLYTARGRHRIQNLDELQEDNVYVITGFEEFKRYPYRDISPTRPRLRGFKKIDISRIYTPVQHANEERLRQKSGRSHYLNEHRRGLRLRISYYGQYQMPVHHATIPFNNCGDLEKIMIQIERERQVPQIKQMFKVLNYGGSPDNFIEINDCQELSQEEHVLLTFKREDKNKFHEYYLPQGKRNFTVAVSPRHGPAYNFPSFPDQSTPKGKSGSLNKHRVLPSIGSSSKHSEPASPFSNPPNSQGSRKRGKGKNNVREVDYDQDQSGVYRAKKQNNARGAQQEEIHTKEKTTPIPPGTELNKQPSKDLKHSAGNKKGKAKGSKDFENSENGNQTRDEDQSYEEAGMRRINEYDDSFNQYDRNSSQALNKDFRSSTPASRGESRQKREIKQHQAAVKIQAGARGYMERKKFNARKEEMKREKESRARDNQTKDDQKAGAGEQKSGGGQKEGMNEDEAATKIQASFKGYKTRKEMNVKKQQVRDSDELGRQEKVAATKIQSNYRGYKVRKDYNKRKNMRNAETKQETDINANEKKDDDKDTADAAVKIQSSYRGYRTRKELKGKKTNQAETEKDSSKKYSDDEAAIKIQAGYRGYKTRKDYSKKKALNKTDNSKEEDAAATKIQANYKGYKERQKYHKEKEQEVEDEAASNVQAAFRGYKTRQEISKDSQLPDQAPTPRPDSAEINKAATKIQSNYRGYRTRKEFKDKGQK